jgi:hypothetical protein
MYTQPSLARLPQPETFSEAPLFVTPFPVQQLKFD